MLSRFGDADRSMLELRILLTHGNSLPNRPGRKTETKIRCPAHSTDEFPTEIGDGPPEPTGKQGSCPTHTRRLDEEI